jgi:hypothetical protein
MMLISTNSFHKKSDAPDTAMLSYDLHGNDGKEPTQGRMVETIRKNWIRTSEQTIYSIYSLFPMAG